MGGGYVDSTDGNGDVRDGNDDRADQLETSGAGGGLQSFLDERTDEETAAEVEAAVTDTAAVVDDDEAALAEEIRDRLDDRESLIDGSLSDVEDDKISGLVEQILSNREEEFLARQEMDDLERLIEDTDGLRDGDKLAVRDVAREVADETDLTETAVREEMHAAATEAASPGDFVETVDAWGEERISEWRAGEFDAVEAVTTPSAVDPEDVDLDDVLETVRSDAFEEAAGDADVSSAGVRATHESDQSPLETFGELAERQIDDPDTRARTVEAFNKTLREVVRPFSTVDHGGPDRLNPDLGGDISPLGDVVDETGRTHRSMVVAEGVPDGDGTERQLFITNTNSDRPGLNAQEAESADRHMLGTAGYRAAGFDVPEAHHEPGEYWVAAEAPGEPASQADFSDLDNGYEQFTDFVATSMIVGNWDIKEDNVFVGPDGKMVPVDLELSGAQLDHRADSTDNAFDASQSGFMGPWDRGERLFESMNGDQYHDWADVRADVKRRVQEMGDSGEARSVVSAALSETSRTKLEIHLEENMMAAESGRFFERDPDPDKGLLGGDDGD